MFPRVVFAFTLALITLTGANALWDSPETKPIKLVAPDGSIKANFIPYGAYATNVWVKDKHGSFRDILLGFDNLTDYTSGIHGHRNFGPVVGRFSNRVRNGTFSIPISDDPEHSGGAVYHIPKNDNGFDSLHGGTIGYDRRNWTTLTWLPNSVTFGLKESDQGFPGTVFTQVTYTLLPGATWHITMRAEATEETPIMLSGHHYWNLEAYQESQDLVGHVAQIKASRVIGTDSILVPTGELWNVSGTPLDFRTPKSVGDGITASEGYDYCGAACVGYDNGWIYDNNKGKDAVFSVWSKNSGIRMDVITNQPGVQLYTCDSLYNASLPVPRKVSQGGPSVYYENHSCFALEQQSWIDGINHPEWGVNQIYSPERPYLWESKYTFSTVQ